MPRKLKIDLRDLADAFDNSFPEELSYYLDTQTGEVVLVTAETRAWLENLYAEATGPDGELDEGALAGLIQAPDIPDSDKEQLLVADRVEAGFGARYIAIPATESHDRYEDMERFVETVADARLQDRLWRAISGRGAFRYFKDVLSDYPRERERWFAFRDACERERVLAWLESEDIELDRD